MISIGIYKLQILMVMVMVIATITQIGAIYVQFGTKEQTHPGNALPGWDKDPGLHTNLYYKRIYVNPYYLVPYDVIHPVDVDVERRNDYDQDDEKIRVDRDYYEETKSKKAITKKAFQKSKSDPRKFPKYNNDKFYIKLGEGKYIKSGLVGDLPNGNNNGQQQQQNKYYRLKDEVKPVWEPVEDDVTQRNNYKFVLPEPRIKKTWD